MQSLLVCCCCLLQKCWRQARTLVGDNLAETGILHTNSSVQIAPSWVHVELVSFACLLLLPRNQPLVPNSTDCAVGLL